MGISVSAYRTSIGIFCSRIKHKDFILKVPRQMHANSSFVDIASKKYINVTKDKMKLHLKKTTIDHVVLQNAIAFALVIQMITLMANDIEMNPGPILYGEHHACSSVQIWPNTYHIPTDLKHTLIFFNIHSLITLLSNDIELNPGPNSKYIKVCHTNIQSVKNKMLYVSSDLASKYDIITISETWLKPTDSNDIVHFPGYQTVFRKDRIVGTLGYGGVLAWISNSIASKRRNDLESHDLEAMFLEMKIRHLKFFLCITYRPPNSTNVYWEQLKDKINHIQTHYNGNIMILGDLNADLNDRSGINLINFANDNNLTIHNRNPSRIQNNTSSILEQCLTNFPNLISHSEIFPPIGTSDHCVLSITLNIKFQHPIAYVRLMWDFKNGNYDSYRKELRDTNWDTCLNLDDFDSIVNAWSDTILAIAKKHIPYKLVTIRPKDKPWFNSYLRKLKRKKDRIFNAYKRNKTPILRNKFIETRNFYNTEIHRIKSEYDHTQYDKLNNDTHRSTKQWWTLLKKISIEQHISKQNIPPMKHNTDLVTGDKEKAELFNNFFIDASSLNDNGAMNPLNTNTRVTATDDDLNSIILTEQEIADQINCIDTSKSYGPDGIPPRIIKEGGAAICKILFRLFSLSLETSKFPLSWKSANVIPLHKKEDKNIVSNYRPISLLSIVGKLLEKIVFKHIYNFYRDNFVLTDFQSGFQHGRSTTTQLLEVYHTFCQALDKEKEVRVIFLDISKAFDKVWHKGLLHKLQLSGISGQLLAWLKDYLSNRRQRVVINGQNSKWANINAGVPQGSVLGPLLFLLYINDLSTEIHHCKVRFFADDTCLFIEVDNRLESTNLINTDLQNIYNWSLKWLVSFSPTKTKSLIISNKHDRLLNPTVVFDNTVISEVSHHKYLGLHFSYNLKWSTHIDEISSKANNRLNMLLPLKYKLDRKTLETMYKALVIPILEYAVVVWGGTYDTTLAKLEEININAMRLITGATARSNIAKLYTETSFNSFFERRDVAMLLMYYKLKNNIAPNYLLALLPPENHETRRYNLRNNVNINIPYSRLETFKRSFFIFASQLWNSLPINVRLSDSLNSFKDKVKKHKEKNILYYYGKRWANVHHTRMRLGCSNLNSDLHYNTHVINSPSCSCGDINETPYHYLMECENYQQARAEMEQQVTAICPFAFNTLLFGNENLSYGNNCLVFDAVHRFLEITKRFT